MFEVIICSVHTGQVIRKLFDTREEADRHIEQWWEGKVQASRRRNRPEPSLRNFRIEVQFRAEPRLRPMAQPAPIAA